MSINSFIIVLLLINYMYVLLKLGHLTVFSYPILFGMIGDACSSYNIHVVVYMYMIQINLQCMYAYMYVPVSGCMLQYQC